MMVHGTQLLYSKSTQSKPTYVSITASGADIQAEALVQKCPLLLKMQFPQKAEEHTMLIK
jgi:hypothetical protein